jgi:thymidylate synthase (FAD)
MAASSDAERELDQLRAQRAETRRVTVPALEEALYLPTKVLDHGFVRVVDYMGDDAAIVQAARVSYGRGTKKVREDRGLIRYLMRHRHSTPFEMCEIKFHCKMPIFVARQAVRHRTANINEYSGRYSVLDREFYLPKPEDLGLQATGNRQGRGDAVSPARAAQILRLLKEDAERCYDHYLDFLGLDSEPGPEEAGEPASKKQPKESLARELARMNLNLSYYTQWYWKIDLHNLLHFLSLRMDPHAQMEIRVYAEAMAEFTKKWVPLTWEAFEDYRLHGAFFSRQELAALREMAAGRAPDLEKLGLSKREQAEFRARLGGS